jgi:hypothetical protein
MKIQVLVVIIIFLFIGCSKDRIQPKLNILEGKWRSEGYSLAFAKKGVQVTAYGQPTNEIVNYQFEGTILTFQGSGSSSSTTYQIIEDKNSISLEVEGSIYNIMKWSVIKENPNLIHLVGDFTFAYPGPHYANGIEIADQTLMRVTLIKQ